MFYGRIEAPRDLSCQGSVLAGNFLVRTNKIPPVKGGIFVSKPSGVLARIWCNGKSYIDYTNGGSFGSRIVIPNS